MQIVFYVGVTGFEPATTWSQTRCATGLRYAPICVANIQLICETPTIFQPFLINMRFI